MFLFKHFSAGRDGKSGLGETMRSTAITGM